MASSDIPIFGTIVPGGELPTIALKEYTDAEMPSAATYPGALVRNTTQSELQYSTGSAWSAVGGSGSGGLEEYNTVALLRAAAAPADATRVALLGYHSAQDGGGGIFYYSSASTATENGGTVIKPTAVSGAGRWLREFTPGLVLARWFGAVGDRDSHPLSGYYGSLAAAQAVYPHATALTNEIDWAATQAAIDHLKIAYPDPALAGRNVVGGVVLLDRGIFVMGQTLDFNSVQRFSLILRGIGGKGAPGSIFKGGASMIMYTGADDRFIDMRSSFMCGVEDLTIWYNNASFNGVLIDFSWGSSENDSFGCFVRRCTLSGDPATWPNIPYPSATALISLWNAITCFITDCALGIAEAGIRLREFVANRQPYSNAHVIRDCSFQYERWCIVNVGEMITVEGCTFEGLLGFTEAAVYCDTPRTVAEPEDIWTWNSTARTLTRTSGSWITDGFEIGMTPFCLNRTTGGVNEDNTGTYSALTNVTATVLTFTDDSISGIVGVTNWTDAYTSDHATLSDSGAFSRASAGVQLTFSGSTIVRDNGRWDDDNFQVGYEPSIVGTASNNGTATAITAISGDGKTLTISGTTFAGETATAGAIYFQSGFGTFTFKGNWLGDQFLPGSCWLRFNNLANGITIVNNFFAGATRVAEFNMGGSAMHFIANHLTSSLVPIYFDALGQGWGSTVFTGNQAAAEMYEGVAPASRVFCFGNDTDVTASDFIDSTFGRFKVRGPIVDLGRTANYSPVDYTSATLLLTQGGAANSLGLGVNATQAALQGYGAPVVLQPYSGNAGVGKTPTTSKLEVAGDAEVDATYGFILRSPDGTRWKIVVDNAGALSASAA